MKRFTSFKFIIAAIVTTAAILIPLTGTADQETEIIQKRKTVYLTMRNENNDGNPVYKRLKNGIILSLLAKHGKSCILLDDETVKSMAPESAEIVNEGTNSIRDFKHIAEKLKLDAVFTGFLCDRTDYQAITLERHELEYDEYKKKRLVSARLHHWDENWYYDAIIKQLHDMDYLLIYHTAEAPKKNESRITVNRIIINAPKNFSTLQISSIGENSLQHDSAEDILDDMNSGDRYFTKQEYEDAAEKYIDAFEKTDKQIKPGSSGEFRRLKKEILRRLDISLAMFIRQKADETDKKLADEKTHDESFLEKIHHEYADIPGDIKDDIPARYRGLLTYNVMNSITERMDLCLEKICRIHEKKAADHYYSLEFNSAKDEYNKALAIAKGINGPLKNEANRRCRAQLARIKKTARAYLENRIFSYVTLAEFYLGKNDKSKARKSIKTARSYMTDDMREYITAAAVYSFNQESKKLGADPILPDAEPELYAGISGEMKSYMAARKIFNRAEKKRLQEEKKIAERDAKWGYYSVGGIKMVKIPAGRIRMSRIYGPRREKIIWNVNIKPISMSIYEITREQYQRIMGSSPGTIQGNRLPVTDITLRDALRFCERFSRKYRVKARLPQEAEWDYACSAGTKTGYYWGNTFMQKRAFCRAGSAKKPQEVGLMKPNPFGLYDMLGNVTEMVSDKCIENLFVRKGGSYKSSPDKCMPSAKTGLGLTENDDFGYEDAGFRIVIDP